MNMGIKNVTFNIIVLIGSLTVFVFALLNRKVGGLKGMGVAFLLAIGGLAMIISSMFLFGPVAAGIFWLCTASIIPPVICLYHIAKYLYLKKCGGNSDGHVIQWVYLYRRSYPVIGYVSADGEERSLEFRNNFFLSRKRSLMGVNVLFDMNRPEKAYVEKYSLISYVSVLIVFVPVFAYMVWLSVSILTGNVI